MLEGGRNLLLESAQEATLSSVAIRGLPSQSNSFLARGFIGHFIEPLRKTFGKGEMSLESAVQLTFFDAGRACAGDCVGLEGGDSDGFL